MLVLEVYQDLPAHQDLKDLLETLEDWCLTLLTKTSSTSAQSRRSTSRAIQGLMRIWITQPSLNRFQITLRLMAC